MPQRQVFFISDSTGITVETLGSSLMAQFDGVGRNRTTLPFIDTLAKARDAVDQIGAAHRQTGVRPLVFTSLVDEAMRAEIGKADALVLDVFERFIVPLEKELGQRSSHAVGKSHSASNVGEYDHRIEAINFTLSHDDGVTNRALDEADLILVGVSRSGKTPTSIYMAMQFGLKVANYPLIPEDLDSRRLPPSILPLKHKAWGLTIQPDRLHQIRTERRPNSTYAALDNCRQEVAAAERLMQSAGITFLDSTTKSIEEIATTLLHEAHLTRKVF